MQFVELRKPAFSCERFLRSTWRLHRILKSEFPSKHGYEDGRCIKHRCGLLLCTPACTPKHDFHVKPFTYIKLATDLTFCIGK